MLIASDAPPSRLPPAPASRHAGYGIALETLGGVLLILRLVDFAPDPGLGWILSRLRRYRDATVLVAGALLGSGMVGLFAVSAPVTPMLWVVSCLVLTFTGFSMSSILVYSDGVHRGTAAGHVRVATWREAGADMLLLPAMFSAHQARTGGDQALAFGFWTFVGKATLAVSAGLVLPALAWAGFDPAGPQDATALSALSVLCALVPCGLKSGALTLLLLVIRKTESHAYAFQ